jgi:hypothetical protein
MFIHSYIHTFVYSVGLYQKKKKLVIDIIMLAFNKERKDYTTCSRATS